MSKAAKKADNKKTVAEGSEYVTGLDGFWKKYSSETS
jgi:hypothetical protein